MDGQSIDIPDLSGRSAVVTGANSGIGYHTALQLARHGASVVLACRSRERGEQALASVRAAAPGARVVLLPLDLADLATVREFPRLLALEVDSLDLLVNNAGLMALPHLRTADGFEMQLGVNHLGHFALTGLLLPTLLRAADPRVVTVSSAAHRIGRIDFADLQGERRYRKWRAYGQSKLANLLFAFELDRRARSAGVRLTSVAAHPGWAATQLQAKGPRLSGQRVLGLLSELGNRLFGQSAAAGALPVLAAATAPEVRGGEYFGPRQLFESRGEPVRVRAAAAAHDEMAARRLWEVSEALTGVSLDLAGAERAAQAGSR